MSLLRQFVIVLSVTFAYPLFAETVTFEGLLTSAETFYNGNNGNTDVPNNEGWSTGGVDFNNNYFPPNDPFAAVWNGWVYSNTTDTETPGFGNQYSAAPGGGSDGTGGTVVGGTYALAYDSGAWFNLPSGTRIQSVDWTNGTYGLLNMESGNEYSKKFGGDSGTDPDFFRVQLTGYSDADLQGAATGSVTLSLADFTAPDSSNDFIVEDWQVGEDLSALGAAQSVGLTFSSSDTSTFEVDGVPMTFINTPTYFVIDNLRITAVPEPASGLLLAMISSAVVTRRRRR